MYDAKNLVEAIKQREEAIKKEREWIKQWEINVGHTVSLETHESFE